MFSQKFIFIFIFEYPLRIISELIKIQVDTLIKYYTDFHYVDEDLTAISNQGGSWTYATQAGVTYRDTDETPTITYDTVASLKNIGHSR